jgi:hypothetical protein
MSNSTGARALHEPEQVEQRVRVLSARHGDHDAIAGLDHRELLVRLPDQVEELLLER